MNEVVNTQSGKVRGSVLNNIYTFKGIPYAAPPFAANRLRPPQPVEAWSGVRDAFVYGPKAPQGSYSPQVEAIMPEFAMAGEDCLSLNIWTSDLGSAKHPVMVWIPGGFFEYHGTGASPWYAGHRFARDGIVCVTINYRVGAEGFLYLNDGNANRGLLDQLAALEWVQENIAVFGGDPSNVTIFGESAGAKSIGALLAMPRAKGLFRRAIVQSGAAHHAISIASAQRVGQHFVDKLGVTPTQEALSAIPLKRSLAAQEELRAALLAYPDPEQWGSEVAISMLPWQPVIDGNLIPARPIDCIAAGSGAEIDIIVGTNIDEWRINMTSENMLAGITEEALVGTVAAFGLPIEATLDAYRSIHPTANAGDLLAAIQTDWWWRIPAIRLADAYAKKTTKTYMYEFAWRSPQFHGLLGACHVLEVPFVFDTLGNETEQLWGTDPPQQLADTMHAAWVAFATSGDAGWSAYNLSHRATMRFDTISEVVGDPRSAERALWEGVR